MAAAAASKFQHNSPARHSNRIATRAGTEIEPGTYAVSSGGRVAESTQSHDRLGNGNTALLDEEACAEA
jgi:hypothetical protein